MGEARRRKQAAERTFAYRDVTTSQTIALRQAGDPLEYQLAWQRRSLNFLAGGSPDAPVPCNGCRECCYHAGVDVHQEYERPEDLAHLDLVERDGGTFLRKREDGACIHLGPHGCTVYQHRPLACRSYDCRIYALVNVLDRFDGDHRQPPWMFQPKTLEARAFLAACQMIGLLTFAKLKKAGGECSAHDVAQTVFSDRPALQEAVDAMTTLAKLGPDELKGTLGFDPSKITPAQMQQGLQALVGENGFVMVRDPGAEGAPDDG